MEVADIRGAISRDLAGALDEWHAVSRVTRCKKYLYSLSITPDPAHGDSRLCILYDSGNRAISSHFNPHTYISQDFRDNSVLDQSRELIVVGKVLNEGPIEVELPSVLAIVKDK